MTPEEAKAEIERSLKGRPFKQWYKDFYLYSAHWIDLRARKLMRNPRCERCAWGDAAQIHHVEYKNLYDCTLDDLLTLCASCHSRLHGHTYQKRPIRPIQMSRKKFVRPKPR